MDSLCERAARTLQRISRLLDLIEMLPSPRFELRTQSPLARTLLGSLCPEPSDGFGGLEQEVGIESCRQSSREEHQTNRDQFEASAGS